MTRKVLFTYPILALLLVLLVPTGVQALEVSAKSAVLMDADSGRVLYEKNSHQPLPQASTTKITSAILALEKGNLTDKVRVSKYAAETGGSSIWLETGEVHTLEHLLYAMLLNSANDATVAVAEHICGSEENFVKTMNAFAQEIGAENTHYVNPHGLHDDNHYSSAFDLALIARYAMQNPKFAEMVATKKMIIPWEGHEWDRLLINKNKFIANPDLYPGADGIKNGYTTPAGYCLVASATKNGMRLIAVVLDCPRATEEIKKMFDYGFNNYKRTLLFSRGETVDRLRLNENNTALGLVSAEPFYAALQQNEIDKVGVEVTIPEDITLPIKKGNICGKAICKVDGELIGMVNLMASENVEKPGLLASLWRFIVKMFTS